MKRERREREGEKDRKRKGERERERYDSLKDINHSLQKVTGRNKIN